ncbi:MAG: phospholipase A [Tannerella sp.]|jgi:phospholipase A1|nr:phospholipase A [Tannerella sp.]
MRANFVAVILLKISCLASAQEPPEKDDRKNDNLKDLIIERYEEVRPNYNADSVRRELDTGPYFSLYKDNYFIGGVPLGDKIKANNSNVKFQLSVSQKITRSRLPFDTYLFIMFTQKTIWNVAQKSMPVRDINFNPGIGLGHIIVYKNRYVGRAFLMAEHESNGKDSILSRSWNRFSVGANVMITKNIDAQIKIWAPLIDSDNNRDILRYNGLGHFGLNIRSDNRRFVFGSLLTWRSRSFSFNSQWDFGFKLRNNDNQYFFIQYYNGYGENLFDYNHFKSMVRVGFVIKSRDFSIY